MASAAEASGEASGSSSEPVPVEEEEALVESSVQLAQYSVAGSPLLGVPPQFAASGELSLDDRFWLCRSVAVECIKDEELRMLLEKKPNIIAYDGFEPSGRMHLAQGVMKAVYVNRLGRAGVNFILYVADWFAQLNNKLGGDLAKIQTCGRYMVEVWRACGMNLDYVQFVSSSEAINSRAGEYWPLVMDIARKNTVERIKRCGQIMGRKEEEGMPAAQILYPCMQCADIFFLKADICQLGLDQRKVNMLAREYCDSIKRKLKPIILSHRMMPGLLQGQEKASKSSPDSAVFMDDTPKEVNKKINSAWCPAGDVTNNPVLDYVHHMVFNTLGVFEVKRAADHGGDRVYDNFADVEADFASGALHPKDLKAGLAAAINQLLAPVHHHFETNEEAKALLQRVRSFKITR